MYTKVVVGFVLSLALANARYIDYEHDLVDDGHIYDHHDVPEVAHLTHESQSTVVETRLDQTHPSPAVIVPDHDHHHQLFEPIPHHEEVILTKDIIAPIHSIPAHHEETVIVSIPHHHEEEEEVIVPVHHEHHDVSPLVAALESSSTVVETHLDQTHPSPVVVEDLHNHHQHDHDLVLPVITPEEVASSSTIVETHIDQTHVSPVVVKVAEPHHEIVEIVHPHAENIITVPLEHNTIVETHYPEDVHHDDHHVVEIVHPSHDLHAGDYHFVGLDVDHHEDYNGELLDQVVIDHGYEHHDDGHDDGHYVADYSEKLFDDGLYLGGGY